MRRTQGLAEVAYPAEFHIELGDRFPKMVAVIEGFKGLNVLQWQGRDYGIRPRLIEKRNRKSFLSGTQDPVNGGPYPAPRFSRAIRPSEARLMQ